MKLEYWFELPSSLINLLEENALIIEQKHASDIELCFNNFKSKFEAFKMNFVKNKDLFSESPEYNQIIFSIKEKLKNLLKEKANLSCIAIKTALRIMKKLIEDLDNVNDKKSDIIDTLERIKLFLKITRITIEKVNEELKFSDGSEKSLFLMF